MHGHGSTQNIETLEENLSRALPARSFAHGGDRPQGVMTREEIAAVAAQLDMLDGQADGKLAPGTVAGTVKASGAPLSTQEFLGKLEKS